MIWGEYKPHLSYMSPHDSDSTGFRPISTRILSDFKIFFTHLPFWGGCSGEEGIDECVLYQTGDGKEDSGKIICKPSPNAQITRGYKYLWANSCALLQQNI